MAHPVICSVCGKKFDRDMVQAVKSGLRRYAHQSCMPEGEIVPLPPPTEKKPAVKKESKEDPEMKLLKDTIKDIFGDKANWATCIKQVKTYTAPPYDYSLSGIRKSLVYFYQIKKNPIEKANGNIAIVPYIYKDAYDYFYELFLLENQFDDKVVEEREEREIVIPPPKSKRKIKLFKLWSDDENE